jgi:hypothetical protein
MRFSVHLCQRKFLNKHLRHLHHVSHVSFIPPLVTKSFAPCLCHVRTFPVQLYLSNSRPKSKKLTFMDTDSTIRCFYALNFRQTASMIEICRNQVHTGTPQIFSHTTTVISLRNKHPKIAQIHVYTHGLDNSLF